MPAADVIPSQWSSIDYRRHARRLRKLYAHEPAALQHRLKDLATWHDAHTPARASESCAVRTAPALAIQKTTFEIASAKFASLVEQRIGQGVLRYSDRARLLSDARRLGIGRFYANLVIATLQHRADVEPIPHDEGSQSRIPSRAIRIGFALLIQAAILIAIWRVMH
ncbi:MAG TPA: hypothetical protein VFW23_13190 [Tepidisphaeraceae bacterium]|nr:hypothetical protein [Tepidisphaeraceae bacterium]